MNEVTITIKDMEDESVDISFDSKTDEVTPAVKLARDLYQLMTDYVESFIEDVEDANIQTPSSED